MKLIGIIDTHCHLGDEKYNNKNILDIINDAIENNVNYLCNVGYDKIINKKIIEQHFLHSNIFSFIGYHPNYAYEIKDSDLELLEDQILNNKNIIQGIGEIGLDYYREYSTKEQQFYVFKKQIELAEKYNLPILLHIRDAYDDAIEILKNYSVVGIVHCYTGDVETAKKFIDLGFYISFSGIITFVNAQKLQNVAKEIPINKIVLETDAPYLTPQKHRGKINYPKYIVEIAKKMAKIKNLGLKDVISITSRNTIKILNLKI